MSERDRFLSLKRLSLLQNVFHNEHGFVGVGSDWIVRLKGVASDNPLRRARLCLHRSDDELLHEMIIALTRDCIFAPHRHEAKSESYHMIEGRMIFIMFENDGTPSRAVLLTPPAHGGMICFRISQPIYHAVLPVDDVVYQETTTGPFKKGDATVAPWAPSDTHDLAAYLERAALSCGLSRSDLRK